MTNNENLELNFLPTDFDLEDIVFSSQESEYNSQLMSSYLENTPVSSGEMELSSQENTKTLPNLSILNPRTVVIESLTEKEKRIENEPNMDIFGNNIIFQKDSVKTAEKLNLKQGHNTCTTDDVSTISSNIMQPNSRGFLYAPEFKLPGSHSQDMVISSQESSCSMHTLSQETVIMSSLELTESRIDTRNAIISSSDIIENLKNNCGISGKRFSLSSSINSASFNSSSLTLNKLPESYSPTIHDNFIGQTGKCLSQNSVDSQKMNISSQSSLSSQNMDISSQEENVILHDQKIAPKCGKRKESLIVKRISSSEEYMPTKKLRKIYSKKKKRLSNLRKREIALKKREILIKNREREIVEREARISVHENYLKQRENIILNYEATLFSNN